MKEAWGRGGEHTIDLDWYNDSTCYEGVSMRSLVQYPHTLLRVCLLLAFASTQSTATLFRALVVDFWGLREEDLEDVGDNKAARASGGGFVDMDMGVSSKVDVMA